MVVVSIAAVDTEGYGFGSMKPRLSRPRVALGSNQLMLAATVATR
jgi:hypothetical protein